MLCCILTSISEYGVVQEQKAACTLPTLAALVINEANTLEWSSYSMAPIPTIVLVIYI